MRLLDLFCGAGGAAMGYHHAGWEVVGIDISPQPRYPFEFHRDDALSVAGTLDRVTFDAIHASPPCQRYSQMTKRWGRQAEHPDQIAETRALLEATGLPWVIENVPDAPLHDPALLCGSMFGLGVRRHRHFETSWTLSVPRCDHPGQGRVVGVYGNPGGTSRRDGTVGRGSTDDWRRAMGIDWMTAAELREAIPPAYTEFIGRALAASAEPSATLG